MDCSKINANLAMASCRNSVAGVKGWAILINYDDWKAATKTRTSGVYSAISLASGATGYLFTSHEAAFEGSVTMNKGTYVNSFGHQFIMRAFDRTQNLKNDVNKIAHGKYVIISQNLDTANPGTKYEVYGDENGLVASAIEFNSTDADGIAYAITLASEDNARESEVPASIYVTSEAATDTLVNGLYTANANP